MPGVLRNHADRRPFLTARMRIAAALREHFAAHGFIEVETAALAISPGNETHLHAFETDVVAPGGERARRYLRTSPEFACKKLLAAGERRIFEFARSFRNRERGPLHHPEFTLVEWYRVDAPYELLIDDCAAILALAATIAGSTQLSWRGRTADPLAALDRLTVGEAFRRHAGIALDGVLPPRPTSVFAAAANKAGVRLAADDSWGDIFSRVLVECIEPHLGNGRATILYEYPAIQSPLARPLQRDPRFAERFELYVCGVELANGFGELTDPSEQRTRLEEQMAEKERVYGARYPLDEEFLAALALMPQASGVALGFDRLVMLATGARRIDDVLWTSVPEVE
jgi:elongation factor P--(R)-beta-lysine ligase